jgi:hypothetical protein
MALRVRSNCAWLAWRRDKAQAIPSPGWDTGGMEGDRVDFFVSHAGADRAWAEWVAWQLTGAGYTVGLDVWDWATGQNFMTAISDALDRCGRVVALFSAAYFERERYTTQEWSAAALHVPGTGDDRLVPVGSRPCRWRGYRGCCARWSAGTCSAWPRSKRGRCCWRRWRRHGSPVRRRCPVSERWPDPGWPERYRGKVHQQPFPKPTLCDCHHACDQRELSR